VLQENVLALVAASLTVQQPLKLRKRHRQAGNIFLQAVFKQRRQLEDEVCSITTQTTITEMTQRFYRSDSNIDFVSMRLLEEEQYEIPQ
jgi:hypothetical protein